MKANIYSSVPLAEKEKDTIRSLIADRFGEVSMEFHIRKDVLGGLRIEVGDWVFDGSIQGKLERLLHTIKN